ncbi:hypothetical protein NIASO_10465 [Niabella soli DSM 19437]|uniref:Uncharacterized protein n=1 Tax=Niabella soli DSM 19437 TaxID=929713 RepID=W0F6Y6_9BACT|nr:hypothetical protein NIASO_10465 [Niabella soli DSM 19437]
MLNPEFFLCVHFPHIGNNMVLLLNSFVPQK